MIDFGTACLIGILMPDGSFIKALTAEEAEAARAAGGTITVQWSTAGVIRIDLDEEEDG